MTAPAIPLRAQHCRFCNTLMSSEHPEGLVWADGQRRVVLECQKCGSKYRWTA